MKTTEHFRLNQANNKIEPWKLWGPYLSERQWGTVREDYSPDGKAWDYFPHDHARSRAYRWGEDGLAGISDEEQRLCFALAFWNGKDPILKERLFGLTNSESNHGEDVKEYYFYLDNTPTHSYMKYLYKYSQEVFPYADLVETNRRRNKSEFEYELIDTGIFDKNRYFDIVVEYAKESPKNLLIQITIHNRGPEEAELHVLPTIWFRNQWSWGNASKPVLQRFGNAVKATEASIGDYYLHFDKNPQLLFTENNTNTQRVSGIPNRVPYVKDSINDYVIHGRNDAVNPEERGTKAAAHYRITVKTGEPQVIKLRLSDAAPCKSLSGNTSAQSPFGSHFEKVFETRKKEADEFYKSIISLYSDTLPVIQADQVNVIRQALAGMMWNKQFYLYDVNKWLKERGFDPYKTIRKATQRNEQWHHMENSDIISMPDKWEYPWYAAWDLAFHVIALTLIDTDFGKQQLKLLLSERYMHPNGQMPAYEWNFGDVNPPVHACATIFTYLLEKGQKGEGDKDWLKSCFQKLLLNFTWWVNRKDRSGRNVFEGGFLGLDNIGVFDRSSQLPTGGYLEQADGTAWMALFCQNMLEISIELAMTDANYAEMVLKFAQRFLWIASSMVHLGQDTGMWDEKDGFFYDVLRLPNGEAERLKVRSIVGLLPFCAATTYEGELIEKYPEIDERMMCFLNTRPELSASIHDPQKPGYADRLLCSILDETRLRRVLAKMLDENEFFGEFGIRSLSRYHEKNPYVFHAGGREYRVSYLPAESDTDMFGGNSNWRGPIWMPINFLIIRALLQYYSYFGNDFTVECPTNSGRKMTLFQVAEEISRRLGNIFLKDKDGRRPVYGGTRKFQEDPYWRDYILFFEYFHGDNGAGLGTSHQTGWTGIIATLMLFFSTTTSEQLLTSGRMAYFETTENPLHEKSKKTVKKSGRKRA